MSNPFKSGVKYRVTYYLTAKDGYKFTSNTKGAINGSTASFVLTDATHAKVSLSDLVPGDGKKEISSLNLSVIAPKDSEKPTYTKIDGTGYYSDNGLNGTSTKIYKNGIAWFKSASSYISPGTTETFKAGTEYILKISLLAKSGYKFTSSLTAKINGKTATVETFDDGSINVSVKLTALSKDHKHTDSDWKSDKENHWKICTDTACASVTVAKEAHKDSNKDKKCDVCGYAISEASSGVNDKPEGETSTTEETESGETDQMVSSEKTDNKTDEKAFPWIWIVAGIVVLGAVVTLILVFVKKKK